MDRIQIRPWEWSDAKMLTGLINNKKIWDNVRDQLPHPYTLRDARKFLQQQEDQRPPTSFAITWNEGLVGGIGYIPKQDVYRKNAEIGYWIGEPFWGKGIATAAIGLLLEKIKIQAPEVIRVYAEVFAHNAGSMRALEKNGFYLESVRKQGVVKNDMVMDDHVFVRFLHTISS